MNTLFCRQFTVHLECFIRCPRSVPFTILKRESLHDDTGACLQRNISQHSVLTTTTQNTYSSTTKKLQWRKSCSGSKRMVGNKCLILLRKLSLSRFLQSGEGFQSYFPFIFYNVYNLTKYLMLKQDKQMHENILYIPDSCPLINQVAQLPQILKNETKSFIKIKFALKFYYYTCLVQA